MRNLIPVRLANNHEAKIVAKLGVMANLPYISSPGNIDKALNGIVRAPVPDKVSQDFVKTILKIPGGSGDQMTAFLKKVGLAAIDGSPTEVYRRFRNPNSSGTAVATAIRSAYAPLYVRNEFMHELNEAELVGLIVEETGQAHDSSSTKLTASCIKHLKGFADFKNIHPPQIIEHGDQPRLEEQTRVSDSDEGLLGFNLGYTINLNLPATSDPAVFDAIFRSLKEHLLRRGDG